MINDGNILFFNNNSPYNTTNGVNNINGITDGNYTTNGITNCYSCSKVWWFNEV